MKSLAANFFEFPNICFVIELKPWIDSCQSSIQFHFSSLKHPPQKLNKVFFTAFPLHLFPAFCLFLTHATLYILTRTTMRILRNNGSYSLKILILHYNIRECMTHKFFAATMYAICLLFLHFATKQQKKRVSNRSQVLLISRSDICGDFIKNEWERITFFPPSLVVVFVALCTSARIFIDWIYLFCVFFFGRVLKFQLIINYIWSKFVIWAPRDRARVWRLLKVILSMFILSLCFPPK